MLQKSFQAGLCIGGGKERRKENIQDLAQSESRFRVRVLIFISNHHLWEKNLAPPETEFCARPYSEILVGEQVHSI